MYEKKLRPVQLLTPRNLTVSLRSKNPIIDTVAYCACAASGHAAAAPPSNVMKSQRLMSNTGLLSLSPPNDAARMSLRMSPFTASSTYHRGHGRSLG